MVLFYVIELNDYDKSFLTYMLSASAFLVIPQCRACSGSTSLKKGGTGVGGWITYTEMHMVHGIWHWLRKVFVGTGFVVSPFTQIGLVITLMGFISDTEVSLGPE